MNNLGEKAILSRKELAARWGVSERTVDRIKESGILPWIDVAGNRNSRPIVKFALADILDYKSNFRRAINEKYKSQRK